jgi:predicted acyl esterase
MIEIYRIIILILLFALNSQSQSYKDNDYESTRNNFQIKLRDDINLDCTSFTPNTNKPANGFPCIVYCHGFGKSKEDNLSNAIIFSKLGFVTYAYSMRGQGNSEGKSNLISNIESEDLIEVIEYIKNEGLANKNKIAVIGSSQGGIIPLMALCNGLNVKCVISDLISPDFASNWINNGCVKMSLLWSLSYNEKVVRYNDEVKSFRKWILSNKRDKWDSLLCYIPKERNFSKIISDNSVPVFISNSFQDKYFSSNCIIENLNKFPVNSKFYFGAIEGHGSIPSEDDIAYHDKSMNDWLDYWLNSVEPEDKSNYVVSFSSYPLINNIWTFQRLYSNTSLFVNPKTIKLFFHPANIITELPYNSDTNSFIFRSIIKDSSLTMQESVNSAFTDDYFNSKFIKENIVFETEPISWNYNVLGIPKLHLVYKSDKKVCQFNFQIWEIHSDGTSKLVSSINYTDRNYDKKEVKKVTIKGDALGHIFTSGSKIRIVLTNLDTRENDNFLRTNPYVLPVLSSYTTTIFVGGADGSFIELPLKE